MTDTIGRLSSGEGNPSGEGYCDEAVEVVVLTVGAMLEVKWTLPVHANIWESAQECEDELAHYADVRVPAGTFAAVWKACQGVCEARVRGLARHGPSALPRPTTAAHLKEPHLLEPFASPSRAPSAAYCARAVEGSGDRRQARRGKASTDTAEAVRSDTENTLHELAVSALWVAFLDIGGYGTRFQAYDELSEPEKREAQANTSNLLREVDTGMLRRAVSTLEKWKSRARDLEFNPWRPSPLRVALWIASYKDRGATAPRNLLNTLKWLQTHIGCVFHVTDVEVLRSAAEPSSYAPVQQVPLQARLLLHWDELSRSKNSFVAWIACIWQLLIHGVLRFAHIQRSRIKHLTATAMIGRAALGKARRAGRRAPFWWTAPRTSFTGTDVGQRLAALLEATGPFRDQRDDGPAWLLFDFAPPRAAIGEVTTLAPRKMGLSRFQRFSVHLLTAPPAALSPEEAEAMGNSYCGRRVLPTLAGLREFSPDERVKVGGWLDAEARECAQRVAITDRYNEYLLQSQLKPKLELVNTLNQLWRCGLFRQVMQQEWPDIMLRCKSRAWIQSHCPEPAVLLGPTVPPMAPALALWEDEPQDERGVPPEDRSSDSTPGTPPRQSGYASSTSSGSSSSAYSMKEMDEVQWLRSQGGKGHLHLAGTVREGRLHTVCGRRLRMPDVGVGVAESVGAGAPWSPRCWGRLPHLARRAILAEAPWCAPYSCVLGLQQLDKV